MAAADFQRFWGSSHRELLAIRGALGVDNHGTSYLPTQSYQSALRQRFQLELKLSRFEDGLQAWKLLQKTELDAEAQAAYIRAVVEIERLRVTDAVVAVAGELDDNGSWFVRMFKPDFSVTVQTGCLQEMKLRCRAGYVFFSFDPELTYSAQEDGCVLQVLGTAGAEFTLRQY